MRESPVGRRTARANSLSRHRRASHNVIKAEIFGNFLKHYGLVRGATRLAKNFLCPVKNFPDPVPVRSRNSRFHDLAFVVPKTYQGDGYFGFACPFRQGKWTKQQRRPRVENHALEKTGGVDAESVLPEQPRDVRIGAAELPPPLRVASYADWLRTQHPTTCVHRPSVATVELGAPLSRERQNRVHLPGLPGTDLRRHNRPRCVCPSRFSRLPP